MKNTSGLITGIILTLIGLILIIISVVTEMPFFVMGIYGILITVIGIYMIMNYEKEDEIEQIKKK